MPLVEHHDEKKLSTSLHYLLPEMYFKFKLLVTLPWPQQHLLTTFSETSLKWLTVAMPFLKIRERLEREKREMELWLMA